MMMVVKITKMTTWVIHLASKEEVEPLLKRLESSCKMMKWTQLKGHKRIVDQKSRWEDLERKARKARIPPLKVQLNKTCKLSKTKPLGNPSVTKLRVVAHSLSKILNS